MSVKLLLVISIFINLILIFFLNKKKIKKLFHDDIIKNIELTDIHSSFKLEKISENLFGPNKNAIIKSFSISTGNNIVGMTSDYEAWIISTLSKSSKNIFEFGTCSGKTTYLMALNSSSDAKINSITIGPNELEELEKNKNDNRVSHRNVINESIYESFLFSGTDVENKINVIFQNSLKFDHTQYKGKMDLIFIDGGHTYSIVKNDTQKSFEMLKKNGIILWHDYVPGKTSSKDIVKYLNEISKNKKIYKIKNTSFCFFKND
ncbi:class I SAM-dependent methyltransferase [Candidatus Pelagibacter sp. HIMB1495]|uniref:class I SAM-dependent methyltransferase n=1 Tax=unclassified Candidatus Pelagibacter TaxID=2647897 RepID=UPI003F8621B9